MSKNSSISYDEMNKVRQKFNLSNHVLFRLTFRNETVAAELIEILFGLKAVTIKYINTEYILINPYHDGHNIRCDFYAKLENGDIVIVELQNKKEKAFFNRNDFYQSIADIISLKKKQSYNKMSNIYLAWICSFDPIGEHLMVYHVDTIIRENKQLISGRKNIILYNRSHIDEEYEDKRLVALLKYIENSVGICDEIPEISKYCTLFKEGDIMCIIGRNPIHLNREEMLILAEVVAEEMAEAKAEEMAEAKAEEMAEAKAEEMAEAKIKAANAKVEAANAKVEETFILSIREMMNNAMDKTMIKKIFKNLSSHEFEKYYNIALNQ